MTVKDVARSERLHHSTVKDLDELYMAEQLRRHLWPATSAIGVDEIAPSARGTGSTAWW